ncbi:type II secretion system protein [Moritella marina]|uniref:type II secretion system protein n=1 Tax=Moritella marina TaxID=90736 RepID=UPI003704A62D
MKSNKGFTLIELVIVIIVLGVLAATAVPKFINIHSDARKSTLDGFYGSLLSANSIVMSKAAIDDLGNTKKPTKIDGTDILVLGGQMVLSKDNIGNVMQLNGYNLVYFDFSGGNQNISFGALMVSLGNEKERKEFEDNQCYLLIYGNYSFIESGVTTMKSREIEAIKSYSGC